MFLVIKLQLVTLAKQTPYGLWLLKGILIFKRY
jgi:hypothetical protein